MKIYCWLMFNETQSGENIKLNTFFCYIVKVNYGKIGGIIIATTTKALEERG